MNKYILIYLLFTLCNISFADPTAEIYLENGRVEGSSYKFDISIMRTNDWGAGTFDNYLGSSSFRVSKSSGLNNDPSASAIGSHFTNTSYAVSPSIISGQINVEVNFTNQLTATQLGLNTKYLICTIAITINNPSTTAGVSWVSLSTAAFTGSDANVISTLNGDLQSSPLPVELASFTASANINNVHLRWNTATEVNNNGFEVQRKTDSPNSDWSRVGFVEGKGNSNSPKEYTYEDKNLTGGTKFIYRLKQIDTDGKYEYSKEVEVEVIPKEYTLYQNYPNPFNPTTRIRYDMPQSGEVTLTVYNILGEKVKTLVSGIEEAGYHTVLFDGRDLASGTYIYRLQLPNYTQTKKMLLLK